MIEAVYDAKKKAEYGATRRARQHLCTHQWCTAPLHHAGVSWRKCINCHARYCGYACQMLDWINHKPFCRAVQRGDAEKVVNE